MRIHRLLLVAATATVLFGQTSPRVRPGPQGTATQTRPALAALKEALGLTDQQLEQLVQLRRDMTAALRPIQEQVRQKALELRAATSAANPDPALVGKLTLELRALRQQVQQIQEQYRAQALSLLTAEQKEKLKNLEQSAGLGPAITGARGLGLLTPPPPNRREGADRGTGQQGRRMRQLGAREGRR